MLTLLNQSTSFMCSVKFLRKFRLWQLTIIVLLSSCTGLFTEPCGDINFRDIHVIDSESIRGVVSNGWEMTVEFDFNPHDCGLNCTCSKVAWVQILRSIDQSDGTYMYLNEEKEERATAEGWHVDRLQGREWGYYGRYDDGSFASTVTLGSDVTTASLYDRPKRSDAEPYLGYTWVAITVPVCIDNPVSACNNNLLGYYEWGWLVSDASDVATLHFMAPRGFKDDFDAAVAEWNADAPGLGYNNFPAFTRLSE